MKSTFFIILFFFTVGYRAQQNLIPNPSFEECISCPEGPSAGYPNELGKAQPWFYPTSGSSDLFAECNAIDFNGSVGVPTNLVGFQFPVSGTNYAGFNAFDGVSSTGLIGYSEYLTVPLTEEICAGELLEVRFFLSLADSSKFAVSKIGVSLEDIAKIESNSTYSLDESFNLLHPIGFIDDTTNWVEIIDTIRSRSSSRWFTIGYFNDEYDDTIVVNPEGFEMSYYYVDSLSLVPIGDNESESLEGIMPNVFSPNGDGVNDLFVTPVSGEIRIYNRWGKLVFESLQSYTYWSGKLPNGNEATEGIYYWIIHVEDSNCNLKSKQLKGTIQLVR